MAKFKSDFLNVLDQRGFIHQISDPEGLDKLAASGRITGYIGYDATATSIHIGNLITVTMLYWLQETGHRPISLMGGGTSSMLQEIYRTDANVDVKEQVIQAFFLQGNARALIDLSKKETNKRLRNEALQKLSLMNNVEALQYMLEILNQ